MSLNSWWQRLVARSDVRRARRAAWIAGAFVVALLYALGGLSLYVRHNLLAPSTLPAPTATPAVIIAPPTFTPLPPLTIEPPTVAPSATATVTPTLFPTLTPNP